MPQKPQKPPGKSADVGLRPEIYPELNTAFYEPQPWIYLQQRLAHLMLVASDSERYRDLLGHGVRLGSIELTVRIANDQVPTAEQSYAAIEAEVLLHQSAETLLRLIHAHADPDEPCPWLRMSRLRSAKAFKEWVQGVVRKPPQGRQSLCESVFAHGGPEALPHLAAYLALLAQHFLDATPYNAAKHGLAVHGAAEQMTVEVDHLEILNESGAALSWLARQPRTDQPGERWTRVDRLLSLEATVALVHVAASLIRSVWLRGRHEHLGEPLTEVFRPLPPNELFATFGVRHPVLAEFITALRYEGEEPQLIVRTRHLQPPPPPD